jgi:hypothetical protein
MTGQYDTSNSGSTNCDPQCIGATLFRLAIWPVQQDGAIASDFGFGRGHTIVGIRGSSAAEFQAGSLLSCNDVDEFDAAP